MDAGKGKEYSYGVRVKIKDFGIGISQETIKNIASVGKSTVKNVRAS